MIFLKNTHFIVFLVKFIWSKHKAMCCQFCKCSILCIDNLIWSIFAHKFLSVAPSKLGNKITVYNNCLFSISFCYMWGRCLLWNRRPWEEEGDRKEMLPQGHGPLWRSAESYRCAIQKNAWRGVPTLDSVSRG